MGKKDPSGAEDSNYRQKCLDAKGRSCVICGDETDIEVHHIDGNRDNNDIENLVPLCGDHHSAIHNPSFRELSNQLPEESMSGRPPQTSDKDYLNLLSDSDTPVLFTSEFAGAFDVTQQGAYNRLSDLEDRGLIGSKTASECVWWLTPLGLSRTN